MPEKKGDLHIIDTISETDLEKTAEELISLAGNCKIWLFEGEIGAGKTTLIKAICNLLAVNEQVCSPTFSIINEYISTENARVFHFDFYRIESEREAKETGCEEYFLSGEYCFIEWPSAVLPLLPEYKFKIQLSVNEDKTRLIKTHKYGY